MPPKQATQLGIMFRREHPPELLPEFARRAETAGFDELWITEDCFYPGGIAAAATALASTKSISVGIGIMAAVARNPAYTAMEIATLARIYPGRVLPGIGHGMAGWMKQIGAFPRSQLAALEDTTQVVRRLLAGERFSFHGKHVTIDDAALVSPPEQVPPISLGVRGPKSLRLSGRVADGTILAEFAAPAYVSWVRSQIALGQAEAGHTRPHRLTVFQFASAAPIADARRELRPLTAQTMATGFIDAQLAPMGILPDVQHLLKKGGIPQLESEMQDAWIDALTIAGTPEHWRKALQRLADAGADSVVLVPLPERGLDEIERFARHLPQK